MQTEVTFGFICPFPLWFFISSLVDLLSSLFGLFLKMYKSHTFVQTARLTTSYTIYCFSSFYLASGYWRSEDAGIHSELNVFTKIMCARNILIILSFPSHSLYYAKKGKSFCIFLCWWWFYLHSFLLLFPRVYRTTFCWGITTKDHARTSWGIPERLWCGIVHKSLEYLLDLESSSFSRHRY